MTKEEKIADLRRDIDKIRKADDYPHSSLEGLAYIERTIRFINDKYGTSFRGYRDALSEAQSYLWNKHDKLCGYY